MAGVRDDATPRVHMRPLDSGLAESFLDQPAGKTFPKAEQMVLRLEIQLPRGFQIVQQSFQGAKIAPKFSIESAISRAIDERISQLLMPDIDAPDDGKRRAQMSPRSSLSRPGVGR